MPKKTIDSFLSDLHGLDRDEQMEMLIEIAERFRGVPEEIAVRPYPHDHRVPGCESDAYVWAAPNDDGTLHFYFAVENPQGISAKALAVILEESLSGAPREEILRTSEAIVYEIFGRELSMGKGQGLRNMVGVTKHFAKQQSSA